VIHGHIPGDSATLVDVPSGSHRTGDAQPLRVGLTNGTVLEDRIGVHEIDNGQLQFRMIQGEMTSDEKYAIQKNLNLEQREFQKP
jgi:hypothetical protein